MQEFWLDKRTGGVCLSISSNALMITGIDDRRYWKRISTEESRYVFPHFAPGWAKSAGPFLVSVFSLLGEQVSF